MAEETITENIGNNGNEENNGGNTGIEQKFTQADVDRIVSQRLARATKDLPNEDELKGYRDWKSKQQSEADKLKEMTKLRDEANANLKDANAKIEQYEHEKYLLSKGVSQDDIDYFSFKIGQKVSDSVTFEAAADEFLKEKGAKRAKVDLGGSLGGQAKKMTPNEQMNNLIRGKF